MHIDPVPYAFSIWNWATHPANADIVNGCFEIIGAIAAWMNVFVYLKHRALQGVFWPNTLFYTSWGLWNLIYYSALSQPVSFYAGVFLTSGSATWVILVAYDKLKARLANPDGSRSRNSKKLHVTGSSPQHSNT